MIKPVIKFLADTSSLRSSTKFIRKLIRRKSWKEITIFNKYFNINYI